jgi:hypothetical protein
LGLNAKLAFNPEQSPPAVLVWKWQDASNARIGTQRKYVPSMCMVAESIQFAVPFSGAALRLGSGLCKGRVVLWLLFPFPVN